MEVQLYVYDLSQGLARQFSGTFLGTQIDAVYHTSVVVGGRREYFFGRGIQSAVPGSTHHGQPMEIISMGTTELDVDTVQDYLRSMREVYTAESYDLFANNCNNFSNDFAQFLLGKGIPEKITNLPQTVLNTPFGQMLKPQLDQAMRGVTQAPLAGDELDGELGNGQINGNGSKAVASSSPSASQNHSEGRVQDVSTLTQLDALLAAAASSGAVIFFTSKTCPPCKICYPIYDSLAAEFGSKVTLIKVDTSVARDVAVRYRISATPTFMTYLFGDKLDEWKGADAKGLEQKVRQLVQMAHPPHPHLSYRLPNLQQWYSKPVLYAKVPPLEKLLGQLGDAAADPAIASLGHFVRDRFVTANAGIVPVPDVNAISKAVQSWILRLPPTKLFALVDLLRVAAVDPRISGILAEEDVSSSVFLNVLEHITGDEEYPYSTHITTVQAGCNLFSSELYPPKLLSDQSLAEPLVSLIAISLLDEKHATLRVSAASLAFNIASWNHRNRLEQKPDLLKESMQIELAASLVEAIAREENADSLQGLVLALGLLAYCAPANGELHGVLSALNAAETLGTKKVESGSEKLRKLIEEVKQVVG